MPARARREIIDESEPGLYHCHCRCVRRAFLCGDGQEHRRSWIEERLEFLASQMGVDIIGYAILNNHYHATLRNRPDVVSQWSDEEVARRWLTLCPGSQSPGSQSPGSQSSRKKRKGKGGQPAEADDRRAGEPDERAEPTAEAVAALVADERRLAELRRRLSSISWFMKFTNEFIAKRANAEDGVTGHFWESRFKSTRLLDVWAILLCLMYVDLNELRAGLAPTPEASRHSSVAARIGARQAQRAGRAGRAIEPGQATRAGWLAPLQIDAPPPDGPQAAAGRRASDKGILEMSLDEYLSLMDCYGRQVKAGKAGAIPADLQPILERLDVDSEYYYEGIHHFDDWYSDAAGTPESLAAYARQTGRRRIRGMHLPLTASSASGSAQGPRQAATQ